MELEVDQGPSEEEVSSNVSDTDDAGTDEVHIDDEGFETLAAEIREVLAELAQVNYVVFLNFVKFGPPYCTVCKI